MLVPQSATTGSLSNVPVTNRPRKTSTGESKLTLPKIDVASPRLDPTSVNCLSEDELRPDADVWLVAAGEVDLPGIRNLRQGHGRTLVLASLNDARQAMHAIVSRIQRL
jgi:hypothetical protein